MVQGPSRRQLLLGAGVSVLTAAGCTPGSDPGPTATPPTVWSATAARDVLDRWAAAAQQGDRAGFDRLTSRRDPDFSLAADALRDSLATIPLLGWTIRSERPPLTPARAGQLGPDAVLTAVDVDWAPRIGGRWGLEQGRSHRQQRVWITWVVEDGEPRIAGSTDAPAGAVEPVPLWWLQRCAVQPVRSASLLITSGLDVSSWQRRVDLALDAVDRAGIHRTALHPEDNPAVLVEVAPSTDLAERVLGSGVRQGAAAVTVRDPGGSVPVVVDAGARLTDEGWRFLLVHELTHVLTDSPGSSSPRWLVEGLAESVARADQPGLVPVDADLATSALHRVAALPTATELVERPGEAYLAAFVAVRLLQRRTDLGTVLDLLATTAAGEPSAAALEAMGWSESALTDAVADTLTQVADGRDVAVLR